MWIELHDTALDHPKTKRLAAALGIPITHALGRLAALWIFTLRMAPDGDLSSFDCKDIEDAVGWGGGDGEFIRAAVQCRFLDAPSPGGWRVHNWDRYAEHLKARKRKRDQRARDREDRINVSRDTPATGNVSRDRTEARPPVTLTGPDQTRPDQTDQTKVSPSDTAVGVDVLRVSAHYRTYHPRAADPKSGSKEWRLITTALGSRSVAELCLAIDGNHKDPHCCGQNDRGKTYHRLELIFRDESHISDYIEIAVNPKPKPSNQPANPAVGYHPGSTVFRNGIVDPFPERAKKQDTQPTTPTHGDDDE